jgi:hypothetical protein
MNKQTLEMYSPERLVLGFDFAPRLTGGQTIGSASASLNDIEDETDVAALHPRP